MLNITSRISPRLKLCVGFLALYPVLGPHMAIAEIPIFDSQIGYLSPADTYAVDIALDSDGNIYTVDPYSSRIRVESPTGQILQEFYGRKYWLARGIARDSAGNVYVSDSSQRIIDKYDSRGILVATWSEAGGNSFQMPRGIFVDNQDRLWMADGGLNKIFAINSDGSLDRIWGDPGGGQGQLKLPTDVFVTDSGEVFVSGAGNAYKLQKFDTDGNLLAILARMTDFSPELPWPSAVVVNSVGHIFLNDRSNYRILHLDENGTLVNEWGTQGSGPGQFVHSHGIALGSDDSIWVAGYHGHDIQQFSSTGTLIQRIHRGDSPDEGNADQRGLALDSNGNIFVSDSWNQRVKKYSPDGQLITMWGSRGTGPGPFFNFPKAIAIDSQDNVFVSEDDGLRRFSNDGEFQSFFGPYDSYMDEARAMVFDDLDNLYVADTLHGRIVKLDAATGFPVLEWGAIGAGPGEFTYPRGMDFGADGNLYVADNTKRIQVFTPDGVFLREWGSPSVSGFLSVMGHSDGTIFVGMHNSIARYTPEGVLLETWGTAGSGLGEFKNVWDIREADDGSLYVSDQHNGRVQRLILPLSSPPVGRPAFQPGVNLGHFLWQDDDDGEWHLRWSADGILQQFGATITGIGGDFALVKEHSFEGGDVLVSSPGQLSIDAYTGTWEDGIDFFAQPEALLKFEFQINNAPADDLVFVGSGASNPATTPFYVAAQAVPPPETFSVLGGLPYGPTGQNYGYYLWQGEFDGIWRLRWISNGPARQFSGSIMATGPVSNVTPYNFEADDSYQVDGFMLGFSGRVSYWWDDGLDFEVPPGATMVLRLAVDGQRDEQLVYIGADKSHPSAPQFSLLSPPLLSAADPLGQPPFVGAQDLGYFIWVDESEVWHVRGNPDGGLHEFTGTITTTVPITSLTPVSLEPADELTQVGQTIQWAMSAASWYDGFDFTIDGDSRITFDMELDGTPAGNNTFIGSSAANPGGDPFALQ